MSRKLRTYLGQTGWNLSGMGNIRASCMLYREKVDAYELWFQKVLIEIAAHLPPVYEKLLV